MTGWSKQSLGELLTITKGRKAGDVLSAPTRTSSRYLQIEDLRDNPTPKFCEPFDCAKAQPRDAIIAWDGANAGTVSCNLEGYIGSTLALLRPLPALSGSYLSRFLQGRFEYLQSTANGTTVPHISRSALEALEIPLPPLAEQERLVNILDEADALRKLRARADRRTAELIPALFHEMFGSHQTWQVASIAELAAKNRAIRTGPFGSHLRHSEFVKTGIAVLGIDNVVTNRFRWTEDRCVTPDKFAELKQFTVYPEDVLITIMGTVGRCVVTPKDLPTCLNTKHLCAITLNRTKVEPLYLWGALLFDRHVRAQTENAGRGAIMEGWNSMIIKKLVVRVPPFSMQQAFAQRVREIREIEAAQARSCARLAALFASLLDKAFKAEL